MGLRVQRVRPYCPKDNSNPLELGQPFRERAERGEPHLRERDVQAGASLQSAIKGGAELGPGLPEESRPGMLERTQVMSGFVHDPNLSGAVGEGMLGRDRVLPESGARRAAAPTTPTEPGCSGLTRRTASGQSPATSSSVWLRSRAGTSWHRRHLAS